MGGIGQDGLGGLQAELGGACQGAFKLRGEQVVIACGLGHSEGGEDGLCEKEEGAEVGMSLRISSVNILVLLRMATGMQV